MKRVLAGIGWFVGIWLALFVAMSVVLSVYLSRSLPADATMQQGADAVNDFAISHAGAMSAMRWGVFFAALLGTALGTWRGILPGTKQKPAP